MSITPNYSCDCFNNNVVLLMGLCCLIKFFFTGGGSNSPLFVLFLVLSHRSGLIVLSFLS